MAVEQTRRSLRMAVCSSVAMLLFALSAGLMSQSLGESLGAHRGNGLGVAYTFNSYQCVGGNSQYRNCSWLGTVNIPEDAFNSAIVQTKVVYRDTPPANTRAGDTVEALWSNQDPKSAYAIGASNAWLNSLVSTVVSTLMLFVFIVLTIYWWRRYVMDRRADADASSGDKSKAGPARAGGPADRSDGKSNGEKVSAPAS